MIEEMEALFVIRSLVICGDIEKYSCTFGLENRSFWPSPATVSLLFLYGKHQIYQILVFLKIKIYSQSNIPNKQTVSIGRSISFSVSKYKKKIIYMEAKRCVCVYVRFGDERRRYSDV